MKTNRWAVGALLAAAAAGAACASGQATQTTTSSAPAPSAASETIGRFVWHDLVTRDAAACRAFYGSLLGWEFDSTTRNGRPYVIVRAHGQPAGGIVERAEMKTEHAAWLTYLSVPDLEAAIGQVTGAGGKVLLAPTAVGAYGRVAVVLDPQGAPLGLAGVTGTLAAEPAQPVLNRFFWMEYLAKDGPAALAFYKGLGGYQSRVSVTEGGIEYNVLTRQRSRAGLRQLPAALKGVEPNWLPYVRVDDPAALAAKARSLGGKVLLEPRAEIRTGTLAIVSDPTGGTVALQKWPL
jgi:predicted enzyme related to lactoylglutathione lyase